VLGNHGLWLALAVFLALRGLSLALIWRRHWRRQISPVAAPDQRQRQAAQGEKHGQRQPQAVIAEHRDAATGDAGPGLASYCRS
jgi:membrane protein implicated in regulation of membrane protease activity